MQRGQDELQRTQIELRRDQHESQKNREFAAAEIVPKNQILAPTGPRRAGYLSEVDMRLPSPAQSQPQSVFNCEQAFETGHLATNQAVQNAAPAQQMKHYSFTTLPTGCLLAVVSSRDRLEFSISLMTAIVAGECAIQMRRWVNAMLCPSPKFQK